MVAYAASANANEIAGETAGELAKLIQIVIGKIPLWIAAFVVILLSFLVAKIARTIVINKMAEKGIEEEHEEIQILGGRMTYAGILILGITIGLKIAGIDLTTILAAVAFGIGFALKDLIMNFLAGVMILLGRHVTIGDFISVGGTMGKIEEIQSRVTIIKAIDGTKVIVPNSLLFKEQVTSYTSNPFRRVDLLVGVDYRTNLDNALRVCMKTLKETQGVLKEPAPAVLVNDFGESAISLKIKAWVDAKGGWLKVKSDLILNIKKNFDHYGINIAWPIRTLIYDKDIEKVEKMLEPDANDANSTSPIQIDQPAPQAVEVQNEESSQIELKPLGEKSI
ncbi:mechanosensitive ion channel family protein [Candidatus Peregrinibacteria bacterium]|nr:mechanosensitive ion channel family protein [Candidatus Peregrinibacteria bacterium]